MTIWSSTAVRRAFSVLLIVNLLDITTSLVTWHPDEVVPYASRSHLRLIVQLIFVAVLIYFGIKQLPTFWSHLRKLPIPKPAVIVLCLFLVPEAAHVMLRMEHYPFSHVGMFSVLRKPATPDKTMYSLRYAIETEDGVEYISFLREGNPIFRKYFKNFDSKLGWFFLSYAKQYEQVYDYLKKEFAAANLPKPRIVQVEYRVKDGSIVSQEIFHDDTLRSGFETNKPKDDAKSP